VPGDPIYLFIHLFKTGGTTINGHLARHLSWDEEFVHLGPWGDRVRERDGKPHPSEWPPERWGQARVVAGHRVDGTTHESLPGREARYLTVLRDPADLLVSRYNFRVSRAGEPIDFWDWHESIPRNPTLRRLRKALDVDGLPTLRDALVRFWYVGVTEHLNDDLPHIFAAMGVPTAWVDRRVAGAGDDLDDLDMGRESFPVRRHTVLNEEMRGRIHAEHPKDVRLYRFAVDRRREIRSDHGWDDLPGTR